MAGRRKAPKLREKAVNGSTYFVSDIYKPDGKRTTLNFGPADSYDTGAVYVAFGKWLKLYEANPHKVLSFKSPWDAIDQMDTPSAIATIGDFAKAYTRWASDTFQMTRSGKVSPNYRRLILALSFIEPYHNWPVNSFGPDELRAVQRAMVAYRYGVREQGEDGEGEGQGLTRKSLNLMFQELRRMWAWGVGRSIVDPKTEQALREVKQVKQGTPGVREGQKRRPVTPEEFAAVVAAVGNTVADMMRIMWFVPIRPHEVCDMRPCDFVRDQAVWLYTPESHKTVGRDRVRAIPITMRVQEILAPRMEATAPTAYLFDPRIAVQEQAQKRFASRRTTITSGNRPGSNRVVHPMIMAGEKYTPDAFRTAMKRGCNRAGIEPAFTPYDLRRTTATRIDAILGKDAASRLLGHADTKATDAYLIAEVQSAVRAAQELEGRLD